jgi:D-sedoheptulose 7-phosphate isomerase
LKEMVVAAFAESARLKTEMQGRADIIIEAAGVIAETFSRGGRLYLFGNGGSAADAQHLAAEFVNRFLIERPPLPAVALTTDTSVLTSISNDYSYNDVFAKQIKALGRTGDVAWGMTTSGNSPNVNQAFAAARGMGIKTIAMTGSGGGETKPLADVLLEVSSSATPRIQEVHITMGHVICELVDYILFQKPGEEAGP